MIFNSFSRNAHNAYNYPHTEGSARSARCTRRFLIEKGESDECRGVGRGDRRDAGVGLLAQPERRPANFVDALAYIAAALRRVAEALENRP
jgi:hypothetical protein